MHLTFTANSSQTERRLMNLSAVVSQLRAERRRAMKEVERIDSALRALGSAVGNKTSRPPLSKEARERIAAAQRERWAKVKGKKK
jgi:hypothetical protein